MGYLFSHGMIKEHWYRSDEYLSQKKDKYVTRTSIKKVMPKPTGELILFKAIWDTRPHICFITGEPIYEFNVSCFAHILSKGSFPKFRLFDKNIMLVTKDAHYEYDNGDRSAPEFAHVMKIHDELIKQYYGN